MLSFTSLYTAVSTVPLLWCRHVAVRGAQFLSGTPNTDRGTMELCKRGVQFQIGLFRTASVRLSVVLKWLSVTQLLRSALFPGRNWCLALEQCVVTRHAWCRQCVWSGPLWCWPSRRTVREISGENWGSACEMRSCHGGDWMSLFLRCGAILRGTHLPTILRNVG